MAKGFPYFKFTASEWLTGDIVFEDYDLQGIFINVCSLYWHRDGDVAVEDLEKRIKSDRLKLLYGRFILINNGGKISIKFLDEQLIEANHISKVNSENGKKGGRPKGAKTLEKKPTAKRPLSDPKAKKSKEEKEEELEKELKLDSEARKKLFFDECKTYVMVDDTLTPNEPKLQDRRYPKEMLRAFYNYWSEKSLKGEKLRFESEKTFEIPNRLATWYNRDKAKYDSMYAKKLPENWWNMDLTTEQMKLVPPEKLAEKKRQDVRRKMGI